MAKKPRGVGAKKLVWRMRMYFITSRLRAKSTGMGMETRNLDLVRPFMDGTS